MERKGAIEAGEAGAGEPASTVCVRICRNESAHMFNCKRVDYCACMDAYSQT